MAIRIAAFRWIDCVNRPACWASIASTALNYAKLREEIHCTHCVRLLALRILSAVIQSECESNRNIRSAISGTQSMSKFLQLQQPSLPFPIAHSLIQILQSLIPRFHLGINHFVWQTVFYASLRFLFTISSSTLLCKSFNSPSLWCTNDRHHCVVVGLPFAKPNEINSNRPFRITMPKCNRNNRQQPEQTRRGINEFSSKHFECNVDDGNDSRSLHFLLHALNLEEK